MSLSLVATRLSQSVRLVALLSLLGAGSLIGLSTDLAKVASQIGLSTLSFLTWSIAGAAVLLIALAAFRSRLPAFNARTLEYFIVAALVSLAVPNLIFFSAVRHVGASFVALSIAFPPLYTYLGALLMGLERFDRRRAVGVVLAMAGAVVLAVLKLSEPNAPVLWIVLTLVGPIILAVGNLYRTVRWPSGSSPDQLAPGMLGAATLMLLGVGSLPGFSLSVPSGDSAPLLLIVAQAVVFAVLYLLYFVLQKTGGPVYLSLLGSVAAVVGSAIAVALLGETAPQGLLVGGLLIGSGIYLLTRAGKSQVAGPPGSREVDDQRRGKGSQVVTSSCSHASCL